MDRPPPLRLTRRGRVVVLALLVLLASAVGLLLATASRASDPAVGDSPTAVVQPYDTLWSIASRTSPGDSPYAVVAEIRRLNGLDGVVVHPGDRLVLPRAR